MTTMAIACILVAAVMLMEPAVGQLNLPSIALQSPLPEERNLHVLLFRERDTDGDGILNEAEYVIGAGRERKAVQREFKVFDADGDARLNLNEFLTVPLGQPENQRGVIDDPVIQLAEKRLAELMMSWEKWDTNGDGSLSSGEFASSKMGMLVPGLESATFGQWDQDVNNRISPADVARTLEVAYGVRTRGGALLRNNCGLVVDYSSRGEKWGDIESLEVVRHEGGEFGFVFGWDALEAGVNGSTERREVIVMFAVEDIAFDEFPQAFNQVEVGRIRR